MKTSTRVGFWTVLGLLPGAMLGGCSSDSDSPKGSESSSGGSSTSSSDGSSGGSSGDAGGAGGADDGSGGTSTDSGGSDATTGGAGGTGGTGGDDGGTGGSAGAPPMEIPDPCDDVEDPEMLPALIEEDTEIGPGCFAINRTRMLDNTTLYIEPGTTIKMSVAGYLSTGQSGSNDGTAAIIAVAEEDAPIKFTSAAPIPGPGNWQCIHVSLSSVGSEFRHVTFEYGGAECINGGQSTLLGNGQLILTDSRIAYGANYGIELTNQSAGELVFENNTFVDSDTAPIFTTSNLLTRLGEGHRFLRTDIEGEEIDSDSDRIEVSSSQQGIRNGDWRNYGIPFLLLDGVRVGQNQAVTMAPGTTVHLRNGSFDASQGYLATAGTEDDPVLFTSAAATPAAGDWPCVVLGADSLLENTIVEYAGSGTGCVSGVDKNTGLYVRGTPTLSNVMVRDVLGTALYKELCDDFDDSWCDGTLEYENVYTPEIQCGDAEAPCDG